MVTPRVVDAEPRLRPLAHVRVNVTPPGRDGMTVELVFVHTADYDESFDRTEPLTENRDLEAIGIDRISAGWQHFAVEELNIWARVIHD